MAESPPISDFSTDNRLADPWDRPSRELGVPGRSPAYGQLPQTGPDDVGTRGDAAYLPAHCLVARVLRGYSLLLWPLVHAGITTAFAMAGPALWAVGEANEHGAAERAILDIAALTSLIPVALQIAYLPTLYSACIHRETKVALLNARPGCPHGARTTRPHPLPAGLRRAQRWCGSAHRSCSRPGTTTTQQRDLTACAKQPEGALTGLIGPGVGRVVSSSRRRTSLRQRRETGVEMPWFPEFASAAELARMQARAADQADPVAEYFAALTEGNAHVLEAVWPGEVVIHDPRGGEVRGHRQLRHFVRHNQSWLAQHHARIETVASTVVDGRAVVELLAHLTDDERELEWPVAVVAESPDDRSVVFGLTAANGQLTDDAMSGLPSSSPVTPTLATSWPVPGRF